MSGNEPREERRSLAGWLDQGGLPDSGIRWVGLGDASKALTIAALRERTDAPILMVFPQKSQARDFIDNLSFFLGPDVDARAHYLPSVDFDFHRGLLPNPEILCERNVGLFHALNSPSRQIFVTSVRGLIQKVIPAEGFLDSTQVLKKGEEVDRDELVLRLLQAGYQQQPTAYDPGIFSVRGGVVDVFCPLYANPLRVEFFGDEVEELRLFDPQSQRSVETLGEAFLIPVGQTLVPGQERLADVSQRIKERLDHMGVPKHQRDELMLRIGEGQTFTELSLLFPMLSGGSEPMASYFPDNTLWVWDGLDSCVHQAKDVELPEMKKQLGLYEKEGVPVASGDQLFCPSNQLEKWTEVHGDYAFADFSSPTDPGFHLERRDISLAREREQVHQHKVGEAALSGFVTRFKDWMAAGHRVHVVSHTRSHSERIRLLFEPYDVPATVENGAGFPDILKQDAGTLHLWQGYLTKSEFLPELKVVLLREEELFGEKKRTVRGNKTRKATDPKRLLSSFRDLKTSDLVIHKDHGIGKYLGLKTMTVQGTSNDFVLLEYRDGDKLYVPVYRLNVLQKYSAAEGSAPVLDKLGGDRWQKAKKKAEKAIAVLAAQLLDIQAKRRLVPGYAHSPPGEEYNEFEMEFPFEETPDQLNSIEDVNRDLGQSHPMDRLICGDVGYGKTEVAMRAAYRCVLDKRQVGVLVPTTVLAFQHFESFKKRFESTGVRVEMVSRLKSAAEVRKVLALVKEGKIDVLIGTHRLLSSDVEFKDLGLVVVDEEHRFGVAHKEKLKRLAKSVHFLTMTATPIPRTLNMAMAGIKDISVITTPPPDRLAVRTFVCRRTPDVLRDAIQNELSRDGQIFFVHNRILSLEDVAEELREWFPKVPFETVHGQMSPDELEKRMLNFYQGGARILLTTAIIESGLDVPSANTIIIDRADHFGLAQLYQLRGRVGRSDRRAYCYLLVKNEQKMTKEAKDRLQVIQRHTDLGSGFNIASQDLEIRGAGDLLGKEQSGHLAAVGIDFYFELLEESIRELRGQEKRFEIEPEINLKLAAYLPEKYVPDIGERIGVYRKISAVEQEEGVSDLEEEIRDRFGPLPEEVSNLLGMVLLKINLKQLHVVRMGCGPKRTSLQFAPTTPASPEKIVALIKKHPKTYSLTPDHKLVYEVSDTTWQGQLSSLKALSRRIQD